MIWRAESRIVTNLINNVMRTMATTTVPVRAYRPASRRNIPWKMGVKRKPMSEAGSAPAWAGSSGAGAGVALVDGEAAAAAVPVLAEAAALIWAVGVGLAAAAVPQATTASARRASSNPKATQRLLVRA